MKKKIFGAVVVVAIAVGAMINVNLNKTSNKGDLALANVEALAQAEDGVSIPCAPQTGSTCTFVVIMQGGNYNATASNCKNI